jgi:hypothetical protein
MCGVLVTSRHELAGLLVAPGARPVALAALSPEDACGVLSELAGAERIDAEPEATADLLAVCGGLPLALRIAAARLATRPSMSISAYVDELLPDPLAALRVERDAPSSVIDALESSYRRLGPDERRLLRLLGTGPAGTVTAADAAGLTGTDRQAAATGLEQLAEAGLLERDRYGFRMHPLTRAFGRSRTNPEVVPTSARG